jgi:glutamate-1-semialdehyde 2,1-aminomutase
MPVGAYGGKKEIMDCVSPVGGVYQAGTLSGNPIAMAAGFAMLTQLKNDSSIYEKLEKTSVAITDGWTKNLSKLGLSYTINRVGSMFSLFFTEKEVTNFETAKSSNVNLFGLYFHEMLDRGVYLAPAQFEALFVSAALDQTCIDKIISAHYASIEAVFEKAS